MGATGPPRPGAALRLEGVSKRYGAVAACRNLSLDVEPGQLLTLLGPSGSGKTTALMIVAGFMSPDSGEIFLDDRPVSRVPPHKRDIGMVFQHYALFPHMTVAGNIAFPLEMRGMRSRDISRRVGETLDMVGLAGYGGRYPAQLSGGQQQRVALARAVVFEPRVLLMDEPLGALDRKLRQRMQVELKDLQRRLNVTVVYVTHDQEEALALSDRLAIMRDGQLEQVGSPADVYEQPDTTFVAEFVGASNVIPGTVVGSGPGGTMEISHASGLVFQAIEPAGLGVGQPAVTCVRPEKLLLEVADPDPGPWNTWSGEITRIVYLGEMTQYTIDVRGVALTVREPNQGRRTRQTGDRVTIRWAPVHTRILRSPL